MTVSPSGAASIAVAISIPSSDIAAENFDIVGAQRARALVAIHLSAMEA